MKKVKYFYNTHTLRYDKLETPWRVRLLQFFGFLAASIVTGLLIVLISFNYIDNPKEKNLRRENNDMRDNYTVMQERVRQLQLQIDELERRDNKIYRTIFESAPIPDSARIKDSEARKEVSLIQKLGDNELVDGMRDQLNNLSLKLAFQAKSYNEIDNMVKNKAKLLQSIPAIQPVSNKDLTRIASGFGWRIDPVYKSRKKHEGLDFTAPIGTPIYATADGVVREAGFNTGGYGNHVVINHGYGYETLYGHMYRVKARAGEAVKRGEVIGWVGSTGKSTGPHCHYEVHRYGIPVDPIYYFYNDLTPGQFDRMVKLAATNNQSLD